MYVVMGATGHVGSAVLNRLLENNESVVALTHDAKKHPALAQKVARERSCAFFPNGPEEKVSCT